MALSNGPGEDAVDERVHRILRESVEAGSRQMGLAPLAYRRQFASLLADAPA